MSSLCFQPSWRCMKMCPKWRTSFEFKLQVLVWTSRLTNSDAQGQACVLVAYPVCFVFLISKMTAPVAVICVPPWYVYPRTHITSDMCTPGRDTQNTEALNPGLQTWRLRGTDFVGLYFKVSTDPNLKRSSIVCVTIYRWWNNSLYLRKGS